MTTLYIIGFLIIFMILAHWTGEYDRKDCKRSGR
jgi:hypothetical protein